MSNYYQITVHPITLKRKKAYWMDNYFGRHRYGINFPGSDTVFDEKDILHAAKPKKKQNGKANKK